MSENLIQLENVRKTYRMKGGDVHALKGIDLVVQRGEFVSVVGTSGCGKSTLLYVLGALIESTAGNYLFENRSVSEMSDSGRAAFRGHDIGFVFQSFHLVPQLNVFRNVMLASRYPGPGQPRMPRRQIQSRAAELISLVGLSNRKSHRPHELSNGQMQRVAIARALFNQPRLLLADEPTGNLDVKTRDEVFSTLLEINRSGTTIVMVTHDDELAGLASRQIRLSDGEVV